MSADDAVVVVVDDDGNEALLKALAQEMVGMSIEERHRPLSSGDARIEGKSVGVACHLAAAAGSEQEHDSAIADAAVAALETSTVVVDEELDFVPDEAATQTNQTARNQQYTQVNQINKKQFRKMFGKDHEAASRVYAGQLFSLELDAEAPGGFSVGINEQRFSALLRSEQLPLDQRRDRSQLIGLPINMAALLASAGVSELDTATMLARAWIPCAQVYRSGLLMLLESNSRKFRPATGPQPNVLHDLTITTPMAYTMLVVTIERLLTLKFDETMDGRKLHTPEGKPAVSPEVYALAQKRQSLRNELCAAMRKQVEAEQRVARQQLVTYFRGDKTTIIMQHQTMADALAAISQHQYAVMILNALERGIMTLQGIALPLHDLLITPAAAPIAAHRSLPEKCDYFASLIGSFSLSYLDELKKTTMLKLAMYSVCASEDFDAVTFWRSSTDSHPTLPAFPLNTAERPLKPRRWNMGHLVCQLSALDKRWRRALCRLANTLIDALASDRVKITQVPAQLQDLLAMPYELDVTRNPPTAEGMDAKFSGWAQDMIVLLTKTVKTHVQKDTLPEKAPETLVDAFRQWFELMMAAPENGFLGWPDESIVPLKPGDELPEELPTDPVRKLYLCGDRLEMSDVFNVQNLLPLDMPAELVARCTDAQSYSRLIASVVYEVAKKEDVAEQQAQSAGKAAAIGATLDAQRNAIFRKGKGKRAGRTP